MRDQKVTKTVTKAVPRPLGSPGRIGGLEAIRENSKVFLLQVKLFAIPTRFRYRLEHLTLTGEVLRR